jgi:hypothetical protein
MGGGGADVDWSYMMDDGSKLRGLTNNLLYCGSLSVWIKFDGALDQWNVSIES